MPIPSDIYEEKKISSSKGKWKNGLVIFLFIAPALFIYLLYVVYPIIATFEYSFHTWTTAGEKMFVGLENYANLFADPVFWTSLKNNIWVVLTSVFIQIPLGLIMALLLVSPIKGIRFFNSVYFLPFLVSTVATGMLWVFMFDPLNGIMSQIVSIFGIENIFWLSAPETAMLSILFVVVWQGAPFYMILLRSAIVGIPEELYEAAKIDGASSWQNFKHITLPLLMPTIVTSSILAIVGSLKAFDLFFVMTEGGPNGATEIMGTFMFKQVFMNYNTGYASAIAFVMFFIALTVTIVIQSINSSKRRKEML
ncbi:carbohydrate ABC transporter permease [Oceanobacillus sp. CFH 90083]|uniref:carbohydrate ABC transporter permease n=1 Tax=Oceanobacillus sp. CFH 90083 TaxID=2592336 RepID=UPI00128D0CD4|nr:sugar ABC transporter permease [Oceanobacillus sp. CFH 90083]